MINLLQFLQQLTPLERVVYVAGAIAILVQLLLWFFAVVRSAIDTLNSRSISEGIYHGFWTDPYRPRMKCEVIRIKRTWRGLRVNSIDRHKKLGTYTVDLVPDRVNHAVFHANWSKGGSSVFRGSAIFKYHEQRSFFLGKWLGPDKDGNVYGGDWYWTYVMPYHSRYMWSLHFNKQLEWIERIRSRQSVLENVVRNHEKDQVRSVEVKGVTLQLANNGFNPLRGVISIPLIEIVEQFVRDDMEVLDLGTGSGFYPIYLAKATGCRCVGVDVSSQSIKLATSNSRVNGVQELVQFTTCEADDLYSWATWNKEYDVVIANLPFSSVRNTHSSRSSRYYESFKGSRRLLAQLILGTLPHVKPGGRVFFSYGESGYVGLLNYLLDISPWQADILWTHQGEYDLTHIYKLELNSFINAHSKDIGVALSNEAKQPGFQIVR